MTWRETNPLQDVLSKLRDLSLDSHAAEEELESRFSAVCCESLEAESLRRLIVLRAGLEAEYSMWLACLLDELSEAVEKPL